MDKQELKEIIDTLYQECLIAEKEQEVPVSACLVLKDGKKIYTHNHCIAKKNPFLHAEVLALEEGFKETNSIYLSDATLIVTLEPCLRCMGAIRKAGVSHLYYRSEDKEKGALSYYHVFADTSRTINRIQENRFSELLSSFFSAKRKKETEYGKINKSDETL